MQASFLLSPRRRLEDAQNQLQVSSYEEQRALLEELQSWYFGSGGPDGNEPELDIRDLEAPSKSETPFQERIGGFATGRPRSATVPVRPGVDALEEALLAERARMAATVGGH